LPLQKEDSVQFIIDDCAPSVNRGLGLVRI
jgi:hypothetical protein